MILPIFGMKSAGADFFFQLFSEIQTMKKRYEVGLEKLLSASGEVGVMKNELVALQPKLKEAAHQVQLMMQKVEAESEDVAKVSENSWFQRKIFLFCRYSCFASGHVYYLAMFLRPRIPAQLRKRELVF